jgi:hypothetical protein
MCPMLDDRLATPSSRELDGEGIWDATSNMTGWDALLGERRGGPDVSIYAAPARAADLASPRKRRSRRLRSQPGPHGSDGSWPPADTQRDAGDCAIRGN